MMAVGDIKSNLNQMKRINILFSSICALVAVISSCQKNESPLPTYESVELIAAIEQMPSSKTVMDQDRNVLWSENDMIVAFLKTSLGLQYQIAEESIGKSSARFTKVEKAPSDDLYAGIKLSHNVIFYPYQENVDCLMSGDDYTMSVSLPSEQAYQKGSFGNGAFPMVAISEDNNFTFLNACGGIRFQFKGSMTVASVTVQGNNDEALSGSATVTAYTDGTVPSLAMAADAGTVVTLNCGSGVVLKTDVDTDFIIALPPVTLENGFTVKITDHIGRMHSIKSDVSCEIKRSALMVMPSVVIPSFSDSDYIDEYGVNHGEGTEIDGVVWAPVNCGYKAATESDQGYPYGKLYQWGRKDGQGYNDTNNYEEEEDYTGPTYCDATYPEIEESTITLSEVAQYPNVFFYEDGDWLNEPIDNLWNTSTAAAPAKTEYDPCPAGWRVPTSTEMESLIANGQYDETKGGFWYSGQTEYSESEAKVFFVAAGSNAYGASSYRGYMGNYWTSTSIADGSAYSLYFDIIESYESLLSEDFNRSTGMSVRCVRDLTAL